MYQSGAAPLFYMVKFSQEIIMVFQFEIFHNHSGALVVGRWNRYHQQALVLLIFSPIVSANIDNT